MSLRPPQPYHPFFLSLIAKPANSGSTTASGQVSCNHSARPTTVADHLMSAQVIDRTLSSGDHFDVELIKQCTKMIDILRQAIRNLVINYVGRFNG
jgi:hypothetical protein